MFNSINADALTIMIVYAFASQLVLEILFFGWDRTQRKANYYKWKAFVTKTPRHRSIGRLVSFAGVIWWSTSLFRYPSETLIAAVVSVALFAVSLYYTFGIPRHLQLK